MLQVKEKFPGVLLCFLLALPCWWLGHKFPVIGAPVFAIVLGMIRHTDLPPERDVSERHSIHIQKDSAVCSYSAWFRTESV